MSFIRFLAPYNKITGTDSIQMEAKNIKDLANKLILAFGKEIDILLDKNGKLSQNIVVMVNRRNAHTLKGADTELHEDSEVIILPYIYGG